jgi:PAS domain S-box-containing protein
MATMNDLTDSPEQLRELVRDLDARLARGERAEEALRESNRRITSILESTTDAFFDLDREGCFHYVNRRAEELLQRTREELLGRNVWEVFPEAVGTTFQRKYDEAVATGASVHYEEFYPPRGMWFEVHGYPSADGVAIYFRDVTERRQAADALRQQKEVLQTIFDRIPVMISFFDARGGLRLANREWERVLGWSVAEAQSCDIFAECYPDPRVRQEALDFVRGSSAGWRDFPVRVRDGRVLQTCWAVVRLSDGTCITIGQDITERKRAEGQLQEYAGRLRALSGRLLDVQEQERRHLARELHDEIGQDLTGLKLSLEYADRLDGDDLRAQLAGAQRLLKDLTNRVRDLSLRLRPTMLDDLGLLPALLWHGERYTAQTHVRVRFEHGPLPDRFDPALETAAYRIVQEALTNVARHAGVREAVVRLWADHGVLGIQVEDRGAGFDARTGPGAGDSGGLSGMQERARLLGGHLEIESAPGAGTRLTAVLPLRDAEEEGERHAPDAVAGR